MAEITYVKSIGELIDEKILANTLAWTAAGASDGVTWTGTSINRAAFATGSIPRSMDVVVAYDTTLTSTKTLSLTWIVQDSPDGTNWSDYATQAATVAVTSSGGGRVSGITRMLNPSASAPSGTPGVDLGGARQYIRVNVIPDLSATQTDTAVISAIGVFGGFDFLAAPQT
jgi:hypothetical protein